MNSAGLESSKEQRQEIDTKEKAALPAGDGNGIYLQTKAPFPVHSLLSTPETQMWMKKGIMLERQLGKGGWGEGAGGHITLKGFFKSMVEFTAEAIWACPFFLLEGFDYWSNLLICY